MAIKVVDLPIKHGDSPLCKGLPEGLHCEFSGMTGWKVQAFAGNATTDEEDNREKQQARGPYFCPKKVEVYPLVKQHSELEKQAIFAIFLIN